jgi:mannose-6-phosphate isomerase-like protein (cupin superfamily)
MKIFKGLRDIRRIVTAERRGGDSYVAIDGPPPRIDGTLAFLWATDHGKSEVPVRGRDDDPTPAITQLFGEPGETRLCGVWAAARSRSDVGGPMIRLRPCDNRDDPAWHATYSFDYVIIVQGEIWLELDDGEVHLKAGDLLIQGGVAHAWHNRSDEACLMYVVSVGVPEAQA